MRSVFNFLTLLTRYRGISVTGAVCVSALLPYPALADLNSINNMTETQAAAARMIQSLCPRMAADNTQGNLDGNEQTLFFRCRELVQNSNQIQNSGATAFSLNLSEAELRSALQGTAPEEVAAVGNEAADALSGQTGNLATRMSALRRGGAISTTNISLNLGDRVIVLAEPTSRGGAASAEDQTSEGHRSYFVTGQLSKGDRERTAREDAFEFESAAITLGYDMRFADKGFAGLAFGYNQSESEIERNGGNIDTTGYVLSAYGTRYQASGIYIDGLASYGKNNHDFVRNVRYASISDSITGNPSGNELGISVGIGHDLEKGFRGIDAAVFARTNYLKTKVDGYWENGDSRLELEVKNQEFESLTLAVGAQLSKSLSRTFGVLVPQVRAELVHEFKNDSRNIIARYVYEPYNDGTTLFASATDEPDRDYAAVGLGVSALFRDGGQAFAMIETLAGLDKSTNYSLNVGVRRELR